MSEQSGLVGHWKFKCQQAEIRASELEIYYATKLAESQKREAELQKRIDSVGVWDDCKALELENDRLREMCHQQIENCGDIDCFDTSHMCGACRFAREIQQALAAKEKTCAHEMCRGADKCVLD